jgi:predicted phosphoribosyltransferase
VVYALPRGGVPVTIEVARSLNAPLDLIIARKIGHPYDPEYAMAAVAEGASLVGGDGEKIEGTWFKEAKQKQMKEAKRRS